MDDFFAVDERPSEYHPRRRDHDAHVRWEIACLYDRARRAKGRLLAAHETPFDDERCSSCDRQLADRWLDETCFEGPGFGAVGVWED